MNYVTVHKDGVYFGTFENATSPQTRPVSAHLSISDKGESGPATWRELHHYIPRGTSEDSIWFNQFTLRVLIGPCQCRNHWIAQLANDPPDFSNPAAWFEWTVRAHNAVNQRLGKRTYSIQEALELWR